MARETQFYETLGYSVVETNALENADILRPILEGQTNILLGQSGMGKSTLTNALLGNQAADRPIFPPRSTPANTPPPMPNCTI